MSPRLEAPLARAPAAGTGTGSTLRWRLTSEEAEGALFSTEELVERHVGVGEYRSLEFLHVNARRIVNRVPARSRMPFRWTINAYRGCSHACVYCFARPTHEYLGLDMAEDFERRIVVKVNAVERLEAELRAPGWCGEPIAMGTNTDPYQKAEAKYHLTRGIVELLGRHGNPFSILTKSTLVLRDLDVLTRAAGRTEVHLALSIGTLDRAVWRLSEPGTPPPDRRVAALRTLTDAGLRCSVLVGPILPGLSDRDEQLEEVTRACVEAGATSVTPIALHLRRGVREHYLAWLAGARPDLVALYRERFRGRAYQPEAEQQRIRDVVRAAAAGARGEPRPAPSRRAVGPDRRAERLVTGHEPVHLGARRSGGTPRGTPAAPGPPFPLEEQMRLF